MQLHKPFACGTKAPRGAQRAPAAAAMRCQAQRRPIIEQLQTAGLAAAAFLAASPSMAHASEVLSVVEPSSLTLAIGGGVAIVGLGAVLVATDPQKR